MVAALGDVVLVINDDVPIGLLKVMAVVDVLFERINGNNGSVKIMERVVIGRDTVAHALQTLESRRVKPMLKRFKLLLKLAEHGFNASTKMRLPLPRAINSLTKILTSRVLPKPTLSAIKISR